MKTMSRPVPDPMRHGLRELIVAATNRLEAMGSQSDSASGHRCPPTSGWWHRYASHTLADPRIPATPLTEPNPEAMVPQ
jgi:hypothetical protein